MHSVRYQWTWCKVSLEQPREKRWIWHLWLWSCSLLWSLEFVREPGSHWIVTECQFVTEFTVKWRLSVEMEMNIAYFKWFPFCIHRDYGQRKRCTLCNEYAMMERFDVLDIYTRSSFGRSAFFRQQIHNEWFPCVCVCQIDCALAHGLPKSDIAVNIESIFFLRISVKTMWITDKVGTSKVKNGPFEEHHKQW